MELIILASFIIIGCLAHWALFIYKVALTIEQSGLNIFNLVLLIMLVVGPVYFTTLFLSI